MELSHLNYPKIHKGGYVMGIVNLIMGLVAAVLIATGIKKEEPINPF